VSTKDIRDALIGKKPVFKSEVEEIDGWKVELRQLDVGARDKLLSKCKKEDGIDGLKLQINSIIMTAHNPENGEQIFGPEHFETLASYPTGSFVDKLSNTAFRVLGISGQEDTEKN